jgi:hypothetical protein
MESSVTSQISPKLYSADIKKLYKDDVDAQSELFEINIFNHILHVAPGKSIADEEHDKLVYFYVYAIKDEKVIANLGVYELLTDEQKLMYDISSFENLLLFDYYYTSPGVIKEFEITGKNNIFDYIQTHLTPDPKVIDIYNVFPKFLREHKESEYLSKHLGAFKKIISIIAKDIKTIPLNDKLGEIKDYCKIKSLDVFKLTLAILEPFYNVQFSFVDQGVSVSNLREKTPTQTFTPKQYVIVSIDQSFVSTSSTSEEVAEVIDDEDEKVEDVDLEDAVGVKDLEAEAEVAEAEVAEAEEPGALDGVGESKGESKAEEEGGNQFNVNFKPKIKPPTGTRIKLKPKTGSSTESAEPKTESKAESKAESKTVLKASKKSKDVKESEPLGSSLNYIPEPPKAASKSKLRPSVSKKPESATSANAAPAPPLGSSLNYVDPSKVKARSSISKQPETSESEPKVSLFDAKADFKVESKGEAKSESKTKLRTKISKQSDTLENSVVSASRSVSPARRPTLRSPSPAPRTKLRSASPAIAATPETVGRGPTPVPRGSIKPRRSLKSKTNPNKPS